MPPCRTPFEIVKTREVEPPHLMHRCCVWYQTIRIGTFRSDIPLLIKFVNNVLWLTQLKALLASKKHV